MPEITAPPEDITNNTGSSIAFSCEVKGWPVPTVEWRIARDDGEISVTTLNDTRFSIATREGPNDYELTSWMQLMKTTREDTGTYACVAINSQGEAKASAFLTIGNFQKLFL